MRTLLTILLAVFAVGCSRTATIHLKDGKKIEAEIKRSDATTIYVGPDASAAPTSRAQSDIDYMKKRLLEDTAYSAAGGSIAREDIEYIDHPGDVAAVIFTPLAVGGLALTVLAIVSATEGGRLGGAFALIYGLPGVVALVPSAVVAIWNLSIYATSKNAAEPPKGVRVAPVTFHDGKRGYVGIGLTWNW